MKALSCFILWITFVAIPITNLFSQACVTPDTSIIAWWSFDDTSSASVEDIAGNHDGVFVDGTSYSSGEVNHAATFTESNYIGIPDDDVWAWGSHNFSIEFWATLSNPSGNLQHPGDIFICTSNGPGETDKWWFALGNGVLSFHVNHTSPFWYVQTPFSPVLNHWYHLAVTRSGDTLRVYIDGALSGTEVVPGLFIHNPNAPLTLGIGEGIGLMNGELDEMTVYNRALSGEEILAIYSAGTSGKCKSLQITTPLLSDALFEQPFSQTVSAVFGTPPYTWSLAAGELPTGITLTEDGTISGTPEQAGDFPITIQVMDSLGAVAQKDFVIKVLFTLPAPEFTIFKSGIVPVPGRDVDYFILVKNVGTSTDTSFISEFLEPWFTYISAYPSAEILSNTPYIFTADSTDSIPLIIRWKIILEPGESTVITYKVKLYPTYPIGETVSGCACVTPEERKECDELEHHTFVTAFAACTIPCTLLTGGPADPLWWACELECFGLAHEGAAAVFANCMAAAILSCDCDDQPTKGAIDPNEKLVLAEKYIQPDELLPYVIHFENIGTIEALDVFVTDTLDEDLDETTLNILTPGGIYDSSSRVLRWNLYGINLEVDSSAYVMYSATPKTDLPSGTEIKNRATIQFEVFNPISTNETVNIIDNSTPEGVMNDLPDTLYQTTFPISWHGIDSIGEIKQYSIFVAIDSGAYELFTTTADTTTLFTGETGKAYRFTCVAQDLAGNSEVQSLEAETSTHLLVLCTTKYFRDADNDGYGNVSSATFSCIQPTGYVSDSTDCNDANATIHPGAEEVCNYFIDDDCDGQIDEGLGFTMYLDADSDGYGNPATYAQVCTPIAGFVFDNTDCNDTSETINSAATEVCNGVDDNCNGQIDEGCVECPLPVSTASTNITSTSARLTWDAVSGAAGYKIRYKVNGTHGWARLISRSTYKKLHDLSPGTDYLWEIKTYCELTPNFMSDWSSEQYFTTASLRTENESLKQISMEIYPVPARDLATIEFTLPQSMHVCIKVFDVNGKEREMLLNEEVEQGEHSLSLNTTHFSKGVYLVKAIYDWGIETEKMVVE